MTVKTYPSDKVYSVVKNLRNDNNLCQTHGVTPKYKSCEVSISLLTGEQTDDNIESMFLNISNGDIVTVSGDDESADLIEQIALEVQGVMQLIDDSTHYKKEIKRIVSMLRYGSDKMYLVANTSWSKILGVKFDILNLMEVEVVNYGFGPLFALTGDKIEIPCFKAQDNALSVGKHPLQEKEKEKLPIMNMMFAQADHVVNFNGGNRNSLSKLAESLSIKNTLANRLSLISPNFLNAPSFFDGRMDKTFCKSFEDRYMDWFYSPKDKFERSVMRLDPVTVLFNELAPLMTKYVSYDHDFSQEFRDSLTEKEEATLKDLKKSVSNMRTRMKQVNNAFYSLLQLDANNWAIFRTVTKPGRSLPKTLDGLSEYAKELSGIGSSRRESNDCKKIVEGITTSEIAHLIESFYADKVNSFGNVSTIKGAYKNPKVRKISCHVEYIAQDRSWDLSASTKGVVSLSPWLSGESSERQFIEVGMHIKNR